MGSRKDLIPAFNQIQQECPRKLPFFIQEHQMVAMNFDRGRSHMLLGIASQPYQKGLVRHETVCAWCGCKNEGGALFRAAYRGQKKAPVRRPGFLEA
jgi:hypothetical protein